MGAGFLPTTIYNGQLYFLFGKENIYADTPGYADFGGGRDNNESFMETAIREFTEETGILSEMITLKPTKTPFSEVFFGTNHVLYRHIYFIAKINDSDLSTNTIDVDINNITHIFIDEAQFFKDLYLVVIELLTKYKKFLS